MEEVSEGERAAPELCRPQAAEAPATRRGGEGTMADGPDAMEPETKRWALTPLIGASREGGRPVHRNRSGVLRCNPGRVIIRPSNILAWGLKAKERMVQEPFLKTWLLRTKGGRRGFSRGGTILKNRRSGGPSKQGQPQREGRRGPTTTWRIWGPSTEGWAKQGTPSWAPSASPR